MTLQAKRSGDYISLNTRRLVDVWLDEFKDVYYSGNPQALSKPVGEHLDDRIAVRKAMKCKPFSSYLDEHFPDMIRPNKDHTQARGFLRNPVTLSFVHSRSEFPSTQSYPCALHGLTCCFAVCVLRILRWPCRALRAICQATNLCWDTGGSKNPGATVGLYM